VSIQFDEYDSIHSTGGYTVTFNSTAASVLSVTYHNGTKTTILMVQAPPMADADEADVIVTPSGSSGTVTFKFLYLSSASPSVVSVYPSAGPITGGTLVQLRVSNVAGKHLN
jgi:hypothetical protein